MVAQLIVDVYGGKIQPRVAASLAPLMNLQLRAIETSNLELRVEKLEKLLSKLEADHDNPARGATAYTWTAEGQNVE